MDLMVSFKNLCEAAGINPANALLGTLTALLMPAAWLAVKLSWRTSCLAGRGVRGAWNLAFAVPEPSPVARAILGSLDSRQASWEKMVIGTTDQQVLHIPDRAVLLTFRWSDGTGPLTAVYVGADGAGKLGKDAFPLLTAADRRHIERKARKAIAHVQAESQAYDRMEIFDALNGVKA